jgi:TRAP-type C4-dicarboxylate transport system permease small subunit
MCSRATSPAPRSPSPRNTRWSSWSSWLSALAIAAGRHIRVEYFTGLLPPPWRRRAEILALLLAILCFGLLAAFGARLAWDEYRFEVLSNGLGNPQWLYTGWLPLLSLLVIARAAGRIIRLARGEQG